jgi:replicative DNA helicase
MSNNKLEQLKQSIKEALYFDIDAPIDDNYEPWILEPLIPFEAITVIDGLGGSGKSWFALDIAYSVGLGMDFLGKFPVKRSGTVLYLTAEEVPQMFLHRLKAIRNYYPANMNFAWISLLDKRIELSPYICKKRKGEQTITPMAEVLEWLIDEVKPLLVILDSLVNFYGLDENSSEDAMYFYDVIKFLMRKYEASFILLHHQNKEGMRSQADDVISFRGSGVLREQARSRIIYKSVDLGEGMYARKILLEKSNYYSPLKNEIPEKGLYLKFDCGKHIYDMEFDIFARMKEEEAKQKGKKKENKNNGNANTRAEL